MRPLVEIEIAPGLFTLTSDRGSVNRWKDGDKVRFHKKIPKKIGGWEKKDDDQFLGKCRKLFDWQSLSTLHYIGIGTHQRLYVYNGGVFSNITPFDATGTLGSDPFTMTDTSADVSVAHTAHGRSQGDYVNFDGATASNGITIDGEYPVSSVTDSDNYVITHTAPATSSGSGGGSSVDYEYELPGSWNVGTWNTARSVSAFLSAARIWALDKWGEDLIGSPSDGKIYVWDTSGGVSSRAALTHANAPIVNKFVMVSPENQHLISLGSHTGSVADPLLIRWSSSEDYTTWTGASSNSAGSKRLTTGSNIVCGVKANREIIVFTDSHIWSMVFTGPPQVFDFSDAGKNGGIRGQNAAVSYQGVVFWMGENDFYMYDGYVRVLPCEVWNHIFDDINFQQRAKTHCSVNVSFGEIWWFYCSAASGEIDKYVVFSLTEGVWTFGTMVRTAFVGDSPLSEKPFAAGDDMYLYNHETGTDDDGVAMESHLSSYDAEIGNGDDVAHVSLMVPDFRVLTGSINVQLKAKRYPHSVEVQTSPVINITSSTKFINPRVKGRQVSFHFSSDAIGDNWAMGTHRFGARAHGKR